MHQNSGRAFRDCCCAPVKPFDDERNWVLLVSVTVPTDKRILLIVRLSNFRVYLYKKCTVMLPTVLRSARDAEPPFNNWDG
jgi:hypothetical protein